MSGLVPLTEKINAALIGLSADIEANRLQLPSPPDNLIALRSLLQQNADVSQISALLSKEPHISARLIKLANSVLFSSRFHVSSVKSAISRLGMQKVTNLVTGLAITQSFINSKTRGVEKHLDRSWLTSNRVAAIAMTLAQHHSEVDSDQALLAGQIHNIGDTPLLIHLNRLTELNDDPELKNKVITLVLKKLSAKVGIAILKKWQFPTEMVNLPRVVDASEKTDGPIGLEQLVHMSATLRSVDFSTSLSDLPSAVTESPLFSLFWDSAEDALEELNTLSNDILSMQQLLRSS